MNVTSDHWLDVAKRMPIPGGAVMSIRRFLVIHYTDGATAASSVGWWRNPKARGANAHIVIDRDGSIIQCRPFNRTAGHAGASRWTCPNTGVTYYGLNTCSIGIELANGGADEPHQEGYDWAARQPGFRSVRAMHKHGGPVQTWECYRPAQIAACIAVANTLVTRYNLDDIVGHEDIAPGRKQDPGPAFPMLDLREACGFSGLPRQ